MWKLLLVSFLSFAVYAEQKGTVERMEAEGQDAEDCAVAPGNPSSNEDCRKARSAFNACLGENSVKGYEKSSYMAVREVQKAAESWHLFEGRSVQVVYDALEHSGLISRKSREGKGGNVLDENKFTNLLDCPDWANKLKDAGKIPRGAVLTYVAESSSQKYLEVLVKDGIPKEKAEAIVRLRFAGGREQVLRAELEKEGLTPDQVSKIVQLRFPPATEMRMKTPKGCLSSAAPLTEAEQKNIGQGPTASDAFQLLSQKAAEEHVKKATCFDLPGYKLTGIYVKNVN